MKKTQFSNFDKQKYEIKLRKPRKEQNADGLCYPPSDTGISKILVNPHFEDDYLRELIIHEVTHSFFWDLPETKVDFFAKTLNRVLRKLKK